MKVHLLATRPHYLRHASPIWHALPEELRGRRVHNEGTASDDVIMVAGFHDARRIQHHRVIYVEHGAGQTYIASPNDPLLSHYAGGPHADNVIGYVAPSKRVADLWPKPAVVAGCPALERPYRNRIGRPSTRTAAITFHFEANMVPEAGSALPHYIDALPMMVQYLRNANYTVIGHRHPRDPHAARRWKNLGVEFVDDIDEVLTRASVLVVDNSSVAYEAARLDIPVIILNAPWYRRDVEHGLRFWSHVPGRQVDDPYEFCEIDLVEYITKDPSRRARRSSADYAYGVHPADRGSQIAARWIADLVG